MKTGRQIYTSEISNMIVHLDMVDKRSISEYLIYFEIEEEIFMFNAIDCITFSHRLTNPHADRISSSMSIATVHISGSSIQFENRSVEQQTDKSPTKISVSEYLSVINRLKRELEWTNRLNWGI